MPRRRKRRTQPPTTSASGPIDPSRWPVDQPGPFRMGFRSMMHTYTPPRSTPATPTRTPLYRRCRFRFITGARRRRITPRRRFPRRARGRAHRGALGSLFRKAHPLGDHGAVRHHERRGRHLDRRARRLSPVFRVGALPRDRRVAPGAHRRHLLGDTDSTIAAMLDGSRPVHERVAFRRHDAGL